MTLGEHFAAAGHDIMMANNRGSQALAARLAGSAQPLEPATFEQIVERAEAVILALPWRNIRDVLRDGITGAGGCWSTRPTSS